LHTVFGKADFTIKKGHVLTAKDVEALRVAGASEVIGARLAPDDVPKTSPPQASRPGLPVLAWN